LPAANAARVVAKIVNSDEKVGGWRGVGVTVFRAVGGDETLALAPDA